jgi:hypothetical protein
MSNEEYQTVFDVTTAGFKSWSFPASGLIMIVVGLVLPALQKNGRSRKLSGPAGKWFQRFFLGFAILWTVASFFGTFSDYRKSRSAMEKRETSFVEGQVMDFKPMPPGGHGYESFVVGGTQFKYADNLIIAGFNHTASQGGPIRAGLMVRIWYRDGEILRLDIKSEPIQRATGNDGAPPRRV